MKKLRYVSLFSSVRRAVLRGSRGPGLLVCIKNFKKFLKFKLTFTGFYQVSRVDKFDYPELRYENFAHQVSRVDEFDYPELRYENFSHQVFRVDKFDYPELRYKNFVHQMCRVDKFD